MNQINNEKSFIDILRDTQRHSKANQVFLSLLAKQKKEANPFDEARTQSWNTENMIKAGGQINDSV